MAQIIIIFFLPKSFRVDKVVSVSRRGGVLLLRAAPGESSKMSALSVRPSEIQYLRARERGLIARKEPEQRPLNYKETENEPNANRARRQGERGAANRM